MPTKSRRFLPRLEAFDERCLPSVTAVPSGNILFITGDRADDQVVITDTGGPGGLSVVADGNTIPVGSNITAINLDMGAGNDTVTYNLIGTLTETHFITAHLGRGADTFTANLSGQALAPITELPISVYGDGGGDTMNLNATGICLQQIPGDDTSKSTLNVYFEGGSGKDNFNINCTTVDGSLVNVLINPVQK